jgi:hypothetical protein
MGGHDRRGAKAMIVTDLTRSALTRRRTERDWTREGYIKVSERGDPLWKFQRGDWAHHWNPHRIADVRIAPSGTELWIKVEEARKL